MSANEGVVFRPGPDGKASTILIAREILASAAEAADKSLATRIRSEEDWRAAYARYGVPVMLAGLKSRDTVLAMARSGLAYAHSAVQFARDGRSTPLADASPGPGYFGTETVQGSAPLVEKFRVPSEGRVLEGGELERELLRWRDRHLAEPACIEALLGFVKNPSALDLRGKTVVLLGAGAEVGPLRPLLEWGATVVAVDLDRPEVAERIASIAKGTAGKVILPKLSAGSRAPGANLLTEMPEIAAWLSGLGKIDIIGAYAYLDGEKHVRVTLAMDRIVETVSAANPAAMVAYLMTPTEVFSVPAATAGHTRRAFESRNLLARPVRALTGGRFFESNVRADTIMDGEPHAVIDSVEARQGPNYLAAKRLQRWRVFLAQAEGRPVSCNVAPMTRTKSVLSNRMYAAGYRGTRPLGIETFDAATTNTVMAALLVHDLNRPRTGEASSHPERILRDRAFHGGLWTCPYQLRTIIEAGVAAGFLRLG